MRKKFFSKELWANVCATFFLFLILLVIGFGAWSSWKKEKQMRLYFSEVRTLASSMYQDSIQIIHLASAINAVWQDRLSPFDSEVLVQIILADSENKYCAPDELEASPKNYIGLAKDDKHTYLILWDDQGKVRIKRRL